MYQLRHLIWIIFPFVVLKQVIAANENHEKEIAALKENRPLEDSGKQNDLVELESQIRRLQAENSALQKKCSGQSEIDRDSLSLLLKYMLNYIKVLQLLNVH